MKQWYAMYVFLYSYDIVHLHTNLFWQDIGKIELETFNKFRGFLNAHKGELACLKNLWNKGASVSKAFDYMDGFVQERHNSIAKALELHLSCTKPLMFTYSTSHETCAWFCCDLFCCCHHIFLPIHEAHIPVFISIDFLALGQFKIPILNRGL